MVLLILMTTVIRRLTKELNQLKEDPVDGFILTDFENIMQWKGVLYGPPDTPFENGKFKIQFTFSDSYPIDAPSVKFLQNIFHPNIYRDGKICVDILQQNEWSPVQTVRSIVLSLRSLLMDPNPDSPANRDAAVMFVKDIKLYEETVRQEIINYKS